MKKCAWIVLAALLLTLAGCSVKETPVFVQRVSDLSQMGGMAPTDRFSGIVVSESVTEVEKDKDKPVEQLFVHEGDDVAEGQQLFAYDTEELELTLEKQCLQLEQLEASIENHKTQIDKLEKEMEKASSADKPSYFVQIRTNQVEQAEAELNIKTKQSEIKKSRHLLENAVVFSPVSGRVTSINESGTDDNGRPVAYIVIQKTGSFRVKGTLNEMQRGSIQEGDRIRMESRLDPQVFWMGTVALVDYDNPTQGNNNGYYSTGDEMGSSSRYPFYVDLDSSAGLLLGQHVYLSVDAGEPAQLAGVTISSAFVCYDEDGGCYVWAEDPLGNLEKRAVELGEYDGLQDVYQILSGLEETDYVAFPDEDVCKVGAPASRQGEGGVK